MDHFGQVGELCSRGVLRGELDVFNEFTRHPDRADGAVDNLLLGHLELVFAVDLARRDEHVDAVTIRASIRTWRTGMSSC